MATMSIKLTQALSDSVARLAKRKNVSRAEIVREALEAYTLKEQSPARASLNELKGSLTGLPRDLSSNRGWLERPARLDTLEQELARLSPEHRAQAEATPSLRARAQVLADELGLDAGDVFHQLQHLARSPSERLRIGLAHGRLRRR